MKVEHLTIVGGDVYSYKATKFTEGQNISPSELMATCQPLADIQCVGPAGAVPPQLHTRTVFARAWEDTSLEDVPTRNVDYLSHEWVEEDIWTSWRYIVARNDFRDKVRLENASWRAWAKLRCHLMTVSPETLNWFKDSDVTWLYGPLQIGSKRHGASDLSLPSHLSMSNFALQNKSIFKARSISNRISKRSFLESTILKNAGAIVQARRDNSTQSRTLSRSTSELVLSRTVLTEYGFRTSNTAPQNTPTATPSPQLQTPHDRRQVHFNDETEQCIEPEYLAERRADEYLLFGNDGSSDGWLVRKKRCVRSVISNQCSATDGLRWENEITMLLPTTLEYQDNTPDTLSDLTEQYGYLQTVPKEPCRLSGESLRSSALECILGDNQAEIDLDWPPTRTESQALRTCIANTETWWTLPWLISNVVGNVYVL